MSKYEYDVRFFEEAAKRFRDHYRQLNPKPTKPTAANFWFNPLVWTIMILMVASFLLSATRTGPVFFHIADGFVSTTVAYFEGFLAVIVVEGAAGAIAYFMVLEKYREGESPSGLTGYMLATVVFASALGLVVNIYASLEITTNVRLLDTTIAIFAGAIATIVLWLAGHILGVLYVRALAEIAGLIDIYQNEMHAWEEDYQAEWNKPSVQKHWVLMVQNTVQNKSGNVQATSSNNVQSVQTASNAGFAHIAQVNNERKMNALNVQDKSKPEQIAEILNANPNLQGMSYSRLLGHPEIAEITTSKGTISAAISLLKDIK